MCSELVLPPKVLGNGLRELDRLLDWLIVEAGRGAGLNSAAGGRRTDQRLRHLRGALSLSDPDQGRLRALERSRLCLYHCRGVVRLGDFPGADVMTSGWYGDQQDASALRQFAIGQMLAVSSADLIEICEFYRRLADFLLTLTATVMTGAFSSSAVGE